MSAHTRRLTWFQFTRPQGARRPRGRWRRDLRCFNSRARKGRDGSGSRVVNSSEFQFTRPQGARLVGSLVGAGELLFQFTRPQGARLGAALGDILPAGVSIHAPARGATPAAGE